MKLNGLTVGEFASRCDVHRNTVHRWIREKRLNTVRISPKRQLIEPEEAERFMNDNRIVPMTR